MPDPPPPHGPAAAHPLVARAEAAEAAVRAFAGQPFVWGERDCARLAAFVLKRLGRKVSVSTWGRYTNELGALRALKRRGFGHLGDALDAEGLVRCAPAMRLPGDIVGGEPDSNPERWVSLCVALSNGRVLGIHNGKFRVLQAPETMLKTAWRTL